MKLLWTRKLMANPEDKAAIGWMSDAIPAKGEYRDAIE
jgi:hypothetical protein